MIKDSRLAMTAGAVIMTASFCAWQLSSYMMNAHLAQKQKSLTQQLASARSQAEVQLENTANDMTSLIQTELMSNVASAAFRQSEFVAIALLNRQENRNWVIEWSRSKNPTLNQTFLAPQSSTWGAESLKGDDLRLVRLEAPNRQVFFVLMVKITVKSSLGDEIKLAAGLLPPSYFTALTDVIKGTEEEMILVDSMGNSYAYTDQQYVGASMVGHPLVKRLLAKSPRGEIHTTQTLSGHVSIGMFDQLRNSNLYMLVNSPLPSRGTIAIEAFSRVAVVALAIALLGVAGIAYANQRESIERQRLEIRLRVFEQRAAGPQVEANHPSTNKERIDAMKQLAQATVQYLRAPISAIIGQTRIAQAGGEPKAVTKALDEIEKCARTSRDFLESLAKSNGLERFELQPFSIESVVHQALTKTRQKVEACGIQIEENFKSREEVEISVSEFRVAVENLIRFFGERLKLSTRTLKRLSIDVEQAGPLLRIRFSDNGTPYEPEALRQFFEPFAVADMQMATLRSLVESFQGTVRAEKNEHEGLRIEIDLPTVLKKETKVPVEVAAPKIDSNLLAGKSPVDEKSAGILPPKPTALGDVKVKEELSAAEEMSVMIRRPKVRGDS